MKENAIKGLLIDVGGVIITNGWDRSLRHKMCEKFKIEWEEFESRHRLFNEVLENGKITFRDYLKYVVFYKERSFTLNKVFDFIKDAACPYEEMLGYLRELHAHHGIRIGVLSNESRELAEDRFQRISIDDFVNFKIVSAFVGMRKPDPEIYRLALDVMGLPAHEVAYIDDRQPYVEFAREFGVYGIHHTSVRATQSKLTHLIAQGIKNSGERAHLI